MATSTFSMSDEVRVLEPFSHTFSDVYEVMELVVDEGATVAYIVGADGIDIGAFSPTYLEAA